MSANEIQFGDPPEDIAGDPAKLRAWYAEQARKAAETRVNTIRTGFQEEYDREVARLRSAAPAPAPTPQADPTTADYLSDPNGAIERKLKNSGFVAKDEFDKLSAVLQRNAIATAEMLAAKGKKYWERYLPEIRGIMGKLPPHQQAEVAFWDHAYKATLGDHAEELFEEGKRMGSQPSSESVNPGVPSLEPLDKAPLTEEQKRVIARLGLTEEQYRAGQKNMKEERWPLQSLR